MTQEDLDVCGKAALEIFALYPTLFERLSAEAEKRQKENRNAQVLREKVRDKLDNIHQTTIDHVDPNAVSSITDDARDSRVVIPPRRTLVKKKSHKRKTDLETVKPLETAETADGKPIAASTLTEKLHQKGGPREDEESGTIKMLRRLSQAPVKVAPKPPQQPTPAQRESKPAWEEVETDKNRPRMDSIAVLNSMGGARRGSVIPPASTPSSSARATRRGSANPTGRRGSNVSVHRSSFGAMVAGEDLADNHRFWELDGRLSTLERRFRKAGERQKCMLAMMDAMLKSNCIVFDKSEFITMSDSEEEGDTFSIASSEDDDEEANEAEV